LPDPLGPISPNVSPAAMSSDMSCKISTRPALPSRDRETFESDRIDISATFIALLEIGYGAFLTLRNGLIALLSLTIVAKAEPVVVAALGDSLTHGFGLQSQEGFVPQMQAWLDAVGVEVRLINAGVSGDTTAGGLSRVGWTLTPDVDGMIVALGANDYLRGVDPAVARQNLAGILDVAMKEDVEVLLVGLEVGSNYGPDYKSEFDRIYPELAAEFGALHFFNWFEGLEGQGAVFGDRAYFQPDGMHPNAEGVRLIVEEMGPYVSELVSRLD